MLVLKEKPLFPLLNILLFKDCLHYYDISIVWLTHKNVDKRIKFIILLWQNNLMTQLYLFNDQIAISFIFFVTMKTNIMAQTLH